MSEESLQDVRVLLLEPDAASAERLVRALGALGARVEAQRSARGAIERLRSDPPDAVMLALPMRDADAVGLVALVKDGPEPPVLVLLDGAGVAPSLERALPAGRRADAVVERGAKPQAVVGAVRRALAAPRLDAEDPEASLPELLVALRERGDSGVLEIRAEGVCTRIALRAGAPVFAEGGALRETLGRMLLSRGALSEADYLRVIERMTERLMESETTRMGEVLVELGLLTPAEVFEALSAQVREKIVSCFRWQRFRHTFDPCEALPDELLAYPCPPLETLLLEGLRAHYGPERLEPLLAPLAERRPVLRAHLSELAARFQLTPAEQRFVRGVDGSRTLAAVRAMAPLDAVHAAQVLAALALGGGLAWHTGERVQEASRAPQAPAVRATAPTSPARAAAAQPAHATATAPPSSRRAPQPAETGSGVRLGRIRPKRMSAPPAALDPKSAALEAERAFRQGLALLQQSALPGALRAFGRACALQGEEPEYRMYEAWTELLVARDDAARATARAKAGACAQRVLARDASSVRAHTILGQLAAAAGDTDTAERHFRAALRKDPEDRDALRGLRLLERRRSS